jgi:ketosteroid isomerase-like protein
VNDAPAQASVAVVRRFLDALDGADLETMHELLDAHGFVFEMPYAPESLGRRIDGRDAFIEFEREVPKLFGPERVHDVKADALASDPNEVVAQHGVSIKLVSGGEYANNIISRFSIRDGKISRFVEYFDPIQVVVALGGSVETPPMES